MGVLLAIVLAVLIAGGLPIVTSMGLASLVTFLTHRLPNYLIAQTMFQGINSFTFLAIPLFIMAGDILHRCGASARLVRLIVLLIGWLPGGLGITAVVATMIFSGLSGSVNADAAAIGATLLPPMIDAGYSREWAGAIVAAAAGTGILIPPSITMIILGTIANLSIRLLFIASLLPAVVVGVAKIIVIYSRARLFDPRQPRIAVSRSGVLRALVGALPTLLAPMIILGGIMSGVFTASEAAAVAVLYSVVLAAAMRSFNLQMLRDTLRSTARFTGVVMALLAIASTVSYILAYDQVSNALVNWASLWTHNHFLFFSILILIFWSMGALMDGSPALVVLVPLFLPLITKVGMNPIHFAIFTLAVIGISVVTPPLGTACFVVTSISGTSMNRMLVPMLPFLIILFGTVLLLAYVPAFSLWLPHLLQ